MLEKIGLPAKPSRRGNNWVLDASNCQGCSSQFTFINRKHHCRRCGGLFCNNCTLQRMFLRGQGDSPVRICEPCKMLEEAARFELRHGHKAKAGRGGVRFKSNPEDEEINDGIQRATISSSMSSAQVSIVQDVEGDLSRSHSVDVLDHLGSEMPSAGPEELRQQALDEKKQYKILKDKGKNAEALQTFKRARELERKAEALELNLRRSRKKSVVSDEMAETKERDLLKESDRKHKTGLEVGKEKHDLTAELRELGWSDMDLHDEDKKSTTITLEGELLSLVKGVSQKTNKDKSIPVIEDAQVVAHKRKALILKREGKLAEAKDELKKAKILEKQLEEQALLAGAEDSDEEFSELIRSIDDDKEEEFSISFKKDPGFDFNHLLSAGEDLLVDSNFEVTEKDMEDPEIAGTLESFGWTDDPDPNQSEKITPQPMHGNRESLASEIYSLKKEALNYKRAGNIAEAMEQLKKAKLLEKDLQHLDSQADNGNPPKLGAGSIKPVQEIDPKLCSKSRLLIQRELLDLKKKVLALKREGRLDEADELLKESKVLEYQLEQINNTPEKAAPVSVSAASKNGLMHKQHNASKNAVDDEELSEDVTDQDMHDPTYLSLLKNLGWNNEDDELTNPPSTSNEQNDVPSIGMSESSVTSTLKLLDRPSKRSKVEVQRELLGLKRKALALRRQGQNDEADEVLGKAKELEKEIVEIESRNREVGDEFKRHQESTPKLPLETVDEEGAVDVTDKDMYDPALLSVLKNLGWKDDEVEHEQEQEQVKSNEQTLYNKGQSSSSLSTINQSSSMIPTVAPRSKGEIQKELLNLKRKAHALRRKGERNEADEVLKSAKVLEMQMEELEAPKLAVSVNTVENSESVTYGYSRKNKNQEPMVEALESTGVAVEPNDKADLLSYIRNTESGSIPDTSIGITSKLIEESQPLLTKIESSLPDFPGNTGMLEGTQYIPTAAKSVNSVDLLTGDNWGSSQVVIKTHNDVLNSNTNALADSNQSGSWKKSDNVASKDAITINKEVIVQRNPEQGIPEESIQESSSQTSKVSLQQEILVHKRLAVTLKREGRLAEALEELRKAKLLEKSLEENTSKAQIFSSDLSISASTIPSPDQKEHDSTKSAPKILSSRERFKLQQESLSHKRQALKLRREGRIQEAESEFELAKQIETQLESAAHDSPDGIGPIDDTSVEDFLDPQLLSALRAIGIEGPKVESRVQSTPEPVKTNVAKTETSDVEKIQLVEQIKAEKIKAVNLKRAGKPSEALDALRRAKLLEKKLNSL